MTKFVIAVMASGFTVTQEGTAPVPSPYEVLAKQAAQAGHCGDAAQYGMLGRAPSPAPTKPLAHAFSTLGEVERYIRDQLGYGTVEAVNQASEGVGNTLAKSAPDFDWQASDRRQSALNHAAALAYKDGNSPDDVLRAARDYEQYLRGETPPSPTDANDKTEG